MPKPKKGPRLGGSASHQAAILSNLAIAEGVAVFSVTAH